MSASVALNATTPGRLFVEQSPRSGVWWRREGGDALRFAGCAARLYDGPKLLEGLIRAIAGEAYLDVRDASTGVGPRVLEQVCE